MFVRVRPRRLAYHLCGECACVLTFDAFAGDWFCQECNGYEEDD